METFPFLKSTRFWSVIVIATAITLQAHGYIPKELVEFLQLVLGSHIVIRTVDRFAEQKKS